MNRLNVAVIFGGCSSEYEVSLESAYSVITNLDRNKYRPLPVGITRSGDWFCFVGSIDALRSDGWHYGENAVPAAISPDRSKKSLLVYEESGVKEIPIDAIFPVLHGKNGEDGTVQALAELADIPLIGCGTLSSALCMDKDKAHRLVAAEGISVPLSAVFSDTQADRSRLLSFAVKTGFPLFVKPLRSGSSCGVSKVNNERELIPAAEKALHYDHRIIAEEAVEGNEVGCAVISCGERLMIGGPDLIELSGDFFDYSEKYTPKTSRIICPAGISDERSREIRETALRIFRILGCGVFARVDMFLDPEGKIYFNEVNTIPGFTPHSRFPAMLKTEGISFGKMLDMIISGVVR